MEFRIADTFTDSLTRLSGDEQKAVKMAAFDLQLDPASPGMQFHRLDRAKDNRFWSVRATDDIRLIVHRNDDSLMLCYADHHDQAYRWAQQRKIETHPVTGAAQLVELLQTVREIAVTKYVGAAATSPSPALFANVSEDTLLSYGVPPEWMGEVRLATEDTVYDLIGHLPSEASEALWNLMIGVAPVAQKLPPADVTPFAHPDAQRRFRVMNSVEELQRALDYPWEKWTVFLHPTQRDLVERAYGGPARVSGSAGTGKTVVALHRAVFLARNNPNARVLLATFSDALASALKLKMKALICNEPRVCERVEVHSMDSVARRLYEASCGRLKYAAQDVILGLLSSASAEVEGLRFGQRFLISEWEDIVDAWQLDTWEGYRDVLRLGRKTRLSEKHRAVLWKVFDRVRRELKAQGLITSRQVYHQLASRFSQTGQSPFDFVVVDEAQDVSVAQLRFLAAMGSGRPNSLFFAGDLGQRIFQQPFSWKALGVDVRGRSRTLKINYRTSHQIRTQADRLLDPEISDVDGNLEARSGTISVFDGPPPLIAGYDTQEAEADGVAQWINQRLEDGVGPHEVGVFVRSSKQLARAKAAVEKAGSPFTVLDDKFDTAFGKIVISTMHLAKGLEFRAVAVIACDDEVVPSQERVESVADPADLQEVYDTERHLLYVACTRARDYLMVTGVEPASEFLDDLR